MPRGPRKVPGPSSELRTAIMYGPFLVSNIVEHDDILHVFQSRTRSFEISLHVERSPGVWDASAIYYPPLALASSQNMNMDWCKTSHRT